MATKGLQEDLSIFRQKSDGLFYKDYRIQADPNVHRFTVRYLQERFNNISVLDLGSGNGALPAQLIDAGFDVSSTSWNGKCKVGKKIYEINLDNGFNTGDVGNTQYDVITAIDIIEHVENPWAFLRSCSQAIKDDGIVMVSTPNIESARARIEWLTRGYTSEFSDEQIRTNRHISPIWRLGFMAMAEQAGLKINEQYGFGRYIKNSLFKKQFFLLIEKLLPQHASGTTTLYILSKTDNSLTLGPHNIY